MSRLSIPYTHSCTILFMKWDAILSLLLELVKAYRTVPCALAFFVEFDRQIAAEVNWIGSVAYNIGLYLLLATAVM